MFKNVTRDPLAVPAAVERASQGPTNRRRAGHVRVGAGPGDYAGNGPNSGWLEEGQGYQHPEEARQRYIEEHGEPYTHPVHGPGHLKQTPLGKEFIPNNPGGGKNFDEFGDQLGEALHFGGVPWAETKLPGLKQHETHDLDYQNWGGDESPVVDPGRDLHTPTQYSTGPEGDFYGNGQEGEESEWRPAGDFDHDLNQAVHEHLDRPMYAKVARVLTAQAREFLAGPEANVEDRSELLYRAARYAATQTSTWSPEASQRAADAFCARVAELIPNRPKVAAAQSVTHVADFDDQLLY